MHLLMWSDYLPLIYTARGRRSMTKVGSDSADE
jgi:hypothetical protein